MIMSVFSLLPERAPTAAPVKYTVRVLKSSTIRELCSEVVRVASAPLEAAGDASPSLIPVNQDTPRLDLDVRNLALVDVQGHTIGALIKVR